MASKVQPDRPSLTVFAADDKVNNGPACWLCGLPERARSGHLLLQGVAVMKCCYVAAGRRCGQMASDGRHVPLRTDLPSPDHVEVGLCDLHTKAVDIWVASQRIRVSGG